jgi:cell division protein FtsL
MEASYEQSRTYLFIKRALEGKMSPVPFLLILGFFSSLVLLYISLNVYFFNISTEIVDIRKRCDSLMDENVRLTAQYNELASPGRIIPMAKLLGMRAGSSEEVHRLALGRDGAPAEQKPAWAEVRPDERHAISPARDPRGR